MRTRRLLVVVGLGLALVACSSGSDTDGTNAGTGTGGAGGGAAPSDAASGGGGTGRAGGAPDASGAGGSGGSGGAGATGGRAGTDGGDASSGSCVAAKRLWFDDFETGDYARWTSKTYGAGWGGDGCQNNALSTLQAVSPTHSNRSEITCAHTQAADGNVHRGYGGLQFSGDDLVPAYTNTGTGIDAPFGLVNTFHSWLTTPAVFQNGKWFSFWTVNSDCGWADEVLTLGLEDPFNKLAAAHYQPGGGTRTFTAGAAGFPLDRWVRITIYVNYHDGTMHVWQDGALVSDVTFVRTKQTICQWHWGCYASGDNDDLVLYEDDNSIWKLGEAWTDFSVEPWFEGSVTPCP